MKKIITRLTYIMNRLKVRTIELAKKTGVNRTLISRWRTGDRQLSTTSPHVDKIANFLILKDRNESIITKTLLMYGLDESTGTLHQNLTMWLCDNDFPQISLKRKIIDSTTEYSSTFRVFLGKDGLRNGVITLLDYVMTLPPNQTIIVLARDNFDWIVDDPLFLNLLLGRLKIAFSNGTTLLVVNRDDFRVADIASFSGPWLSAHLKGYIKSVYFRDFAPIESEKITAVVEDHIGFRLCKDATVVDNLYIGMYTDPVTVRQIYSSCSPYLDKAEPHFLYNYFSHPNQMLNSIAPDIFCLEPVYILEKLPSFGTLSYENLATYYKISPEQADEFLSDYQNLFITPDMFQTKALNRHMYSLDFIEETLKAPRKLDFTASSLVKKRVYRTKENLINQLIDIRNWLLCHKNFHVLFLPKIVFKKLDMEFVSIQNTYTVAWLHNKSESTCVTDLNMSNALFSFADILWEKIPKLYKNKKKTVQKIDALLKKYGSDIIDYN